MCTDELSALLEHSPSLIEVFLYWNQIQGQGASKILQGLSNNLSVKVLDLAWNSLGLNKTGFAKTLAEFLATNTEIAIMDLSNNSLSKSDAETIAEGLAKNHTLYDFMFQGNYGYVDVYGFLIVPPFFQNDIVSQHITVHNAGSCNDES